MQKLCLLLFIVLAVIMIAGCTIDPDATYKVLYYGDMYTTGFPPEDRNEYKSGDEATVLGPNSLLKTGYEFQNWNTKSDGTGTTHSPGDTITIKNRTVSLYAIWGEIQ